MTETTKKDKLIGNLIAGGYVVACGCFLLLAGLGVFGSSVTVAALALPTILLTVGLVFLTSALVRRNCVSMWLGFVFIVPAVVSYVCNFTPMTYGKLYPLYIAIPAIASLFTLPMTPRAFRDHLGVILFFGVCAGIFALQSAGVAGWRVALPVLLVFVGLTIVAAAIWLNGKEDDGDEQ